MREGFIVEDEDELEERSRRRRERRKRRREEREEEEAGLDDEDLDLIGEANPDFESRQQSQVFSPYFWMQPQLTTVSQSLSD